MELKEFIILMMGRRMKTASYDRHIIVLHHIHACDITSDSVQLYNIVPIIYTMYSCFVTAYYTYLLCCNENYNIVLLTEAPYPSHQGRIQDDHKYKDSNVWRLSFNIHVCTEFTLRPLTKPFMHVCKFPGRVRILCSRYIEKSSLTTILATWHTSLL